MFNNKKLIVICTSGIDEEYNGAFLNAFSMYADAYDFNLMTFYSLSNLSTDSKNDIGESYVFELMNYTLIDGIIILSETIKSDAILTSIVEKATLYQIPIVSVDKYLDGCYNISFNYDKAMEDITRHLIEFHHFKTFNFISGIKGNEFSEKRLNVFKSVLREYNIDLDPERIGYGEFWARPTKMEMERFLNSGLPLPDAFVCANDTMASTVFDCLIEAGVRVPEDVAVTGFDGISYALEHQPVITTASHDIDKTATEAFSILQDVFNNKKTSRRRWVDSHIIIGGTCGCPTKHSPYKTNQLIDSLSNRMNSMLYVIKSQTEMVSDLTDNENFFEIFENLKSYVNLYNTDLLMICVDDKFLSNKEIKQILSEKSHINTVYSSKMNLMLYKEYNEWLGMTDFKTVDIVPNLEDLYTKFNNIVIFPMHVHDKVIGYAVSTYNDSEINYHLFFEFLMNLSTALELKKTYMLQQKFIDSLEDKYIHDPLTDTLNRRGFYMEINDVYQRCIDEQKEFFIISADLNKLKVINDTFGHSDGDLAITAVATALANAAIHGEICARFGGDEFIIAGELKEENFEEAYRRRVLDSLDEFNATSGKPYEVTVSMGCVVFVPVEEDSIDKKISEADEKMYKEKTSHHLNRT